VLWEQLQMMQRPEAGDFKIGRCNRAGDGDRANFESSAEVAVGQHCCPASSYMNECALVLYEN